MKSAIKIFNESANIFCRNLEPILTFFDSFVTARSRNVKNHHNFEVLVKYVAGQTIMAESCGKR